MCYPELKCGPGKKLVEAVHPLERIASVSMFSVIRRGLSITQFVDASLQSGAHEEFAEAGVRA